MEKQGLTTDKEMKINEYSGSDQRWLWPHEFPRGAEQRAHGCYKTPVHHVESQSLHGPTDPIVGIEARS